MKRLYPIILIILVAVSGCLKNPFDTRGGQQPAGATGSWETPATPEVMITNLMYAYNEKNIQNYQDCFDSGFVFSAFEDSIEAEAQGNGYLFQFWDKAVEITTTENIFTTFSQNGNYLDLTMSISSDNPDNIGDTLAVLYRNYTLTIIKSDSLQIDTTEAEGLASFTLNQSSLNLWTIYLWEEIPSGRSGYDWGDFKAEYRNR